MELNPILSKKVTRNADPSDLISASIIAEFFIRAKKQEELSELAKKLGPSELWKDMIYRHHRPFIESALNGNNHEFANLLSNFYRNRVTSGMVFPDSYNAVGSKSYRNWAIKLRIIRSLVSLRKNLEGDKNSISHQLVSSLNLDIGNPIPVRITNKIVPFEQLYHVGIVRDLHELYPISKLKDRHILDLGSGIGNVLAIIAKTLGNIECTYLDLPENLILAAHTAKKMCPEAQLNFGDVSKVSKGQGGITLNFIPYYEADKLPEKSIDLIINTYGLPEMAPESAEAYIKIMAMILKNDGRFFSINRKETDFGKGQVNFTMTGIKALISKDELFEKDLELHIDDSFSQNNDSLSRQDNVEIGLYKKII